MEQDSLKKFWELLETDFPLGGPRHDLVEQLDADLVQQLEALGVLCYQRVAETYPCRGPMDIGCPRAVIHLGSGRYSAVCGNKPELCRELELNTEDVSFLSVNPEALCGAVGKALGLRGVAQPVSELRHVYRVGAFIPEMNIRYPVYFTVRCTEQDYEEVCHALRSQKSSSAFAILVPTAHLVSDSTVQNMSKPGIPVLPLKDALNIQDGQFVSSVDPLRYFEGLGYRSSSPVPIMAGVIAQALVCNGLGDAEWRNLDKIEYQKLVDDASSYEIFADELAGTASQTVNDQHVQHECVPEPYFHFLRACIDHRGDYKPKGKSSNSDTAKQMFVRARKVVDIKFRRSNGKEDWKLFKTRYVEKIAYYKFSPERDVRFALIFQPSPPRS